LGFFSLVLIVSSLCSSYIVVTPLVTMFLVAHTHCVRICSFIVRCTHNSLCVVALDTLSCIRCTHITPSYLVTLMFICIVHVLVTMFLVHVLVFVWLCIAHSLCSTLSCIVRCTHMHSSVCLV
jgi:hypothetical protein